jgi:diaminopimelate epimerase
MQDFYKYHGCGNDFVIISEAQLSRMGYGAADGPAPADGGNGYVKSDGKSGAAKSLPDLALRVCDRRLGVGADGLIVCRLSPLTMDIINSDGSVAPMCGNGIRCFARYCVEEGVVGADEKDFDVHTLAGVMRVRVFPGEDKAAGGGAAAGSHGAASSAGGPEGSAAAGEFTVEVSMGRPDWSARAAGIDTALTGGSGEFLGREVSVRTGAAITSNPSDSCAGSSQTVWLSSFFLGTYHTVVWLDENEWLSVEDGPDALYASGRIDRVGRALESHPAFTQRTNVDFARVSEDGGVEMITWERGAGLTAACGTGACSVVALGVREGRFARGEEVRVSLPYGELFIRVDGSGEVFMRGPAERVFCGRWAD